MQNSFNVQSVAQALNIIRSGRTVNHDGYSFKHDTYFDGSATLWHLLCIDLATGKPAWHAWSLEGRNWTPDDLRRALMNRMFTVAETVSFGDILFYDPMEQIELPTRHRGEVVLQNYRNGGMIRQSVYGQQVPGMFNQGPSDYPFHPGPGLPGQFPFHHPQHPQRTSVSSGAHTRDVLVAPGLMPALGMLRQLMTDKDYYEYANIASDLIEKVRDPESWKWDKDGNGNPHMEYKYTDDRFTKGIQNAVSALLIDALKKKGYDVVPALREKEVILKISIDIA
ncbi:hypothetical protein [Pseudomonas phage D6]|nr:hypothetical protein [Pseudomonas phage D6]